MPPFVRYLCIAGLFAAVIGCDTRFPTGVLAKPAADSVRVVYLHPEYLCTKMGYPYQFHASGVDSLGRTVIDTLKTVTWRSSNPRVGTFDARGQFMGVGGGQTTVTATYKALTGNMVARVDSEPLTVPLACAP